MAFAASLPLNNVDASLREMARAIDQLGAKGVMIYTNVAGKPLDAPEFLPLFDEAARRDVPVWLHPARGASMPDYQTEDTSSYEIWWALGWPYETSAAMASPRLFRDLRTASRPEDHHSSSGRHRALPGGTRRLRLGPVGGPHLSSGLLGRAALPEKATGRLFPSVPADTAMFGARAATRCGLDFFGADRLLFASDMPFDPTPGLYMRETIRVIESLDLSPRDKDRIYFGNAERLLKLGNPNPAASGRQ